MNKEGDIVEYEGYFYIIIAYNYHIIIIFHSNKGFNYFQIEKPKKAQKTKKSTGLKQTKKRSSHRRCHNDRFSILFFGYKYPKLPNLNRIGFSNSNFIKRSKKKILTLSTYNCTFCEIEIYIVLNYNLYINLACLSVCLFVCIQ